MKKIFINHLGLIVLSIALIPLISSCSDDEPGSGSENASKAIIDFDGSRLSSIGYNDFYYDKEGRLEEINGRYNEHVVIDYSKGTIDVNGNKGKVNFNSKGYISEITLSWDEPDTDSYADYRDVGNGRCEFNYNSSGNLTSIRLVAQETFTNLVTKETSKSESDTKITLKWDNGNLVSTYWDIKEIEDGEKYSIAWEYNIAYGTRENHYQQMPVTVSKYAVFNVSMLEALASTGLFGKGSQYLPTSIEEFEDGYYEKKINLSFTFTNSGAISTEKSNYYDSYNYTYADYIVNAKSMRTHKTPQSPRDLFKPRSRKMHKQ